MQRRVRPSRALRGTIVPPGDKSVSHRAAILNAIASGEAIVENFQRGADCLATLRCLRLLGVDWEGRGGGGARGGSRPMGRIIEPLRRMGAHIEGREGDSKAPLAISRGALKGIRY